MKFKTAPIDVKAAGEKDGLAEGEFTGYASVFGNVDSYGDVVVKGAFTRTLSGYGERGAGVPAYWSHRMDDPTMNIGVTKEAYEDDHGLFVRVQLDLENEKGAYVHRLIKEGRVSMMSFAYMVKEGAVVHPEDGDPFYEIRDMDLYEVSVVPVGANTETELMDVKQMLADMKVGRSLSAKSESVVAQIRDLAQGLLESVATDEASGEESGEAKSEELETAKDEELSEVKARTAEHEAALSFIHSLKEDSNVESD